MKERIIQFYEDHKTEIRLTLAATLITTVVIMRKHADPKIVSADLWRSENGQYLVEVESKSGKSQFFDITPK